MGLRYTDYSDALRSPCAAGEKWAELLRRDWEKGSAPLFFSLAAGCRKAKISSEEAWAPPAAPPVSCR